MSFEYIKIVSVPCFAMNGETFLWQFLRGVLAVCFNLFPGRDKEHNKAEQIESTMSLRNCKSWFWKQKIDADTIDRVGIYFIRNI